MSAFFKISVVDATPYTVAALEQVQQRVLAIARSVNAQVGAVVIEYEARDLSFRSADTCQTLPEISELIKRLGEDDITLRIKVESGTWTEEERAANPRLDLMIKAVERDKELREQIFGGQRGSDGHMLVDVDG
ncbi:MAG: hypothetical protein JWN18_597 [Parcubacteria group bacterium]|nr:hypothetical protein [Parcubacteria group bacterium]